jgi:hypothetical protein
MPERLRNAHETEPERIDISEDHIVFRWMRLLGVSEQTLIETVRRVGSHPEDVRRALAR